MQNFVLIGAALLPLVVPVKDPIPMIGRRDTIWWNTDGGNVIEHRTGSSVTCSLWLIDKDGSVAFTWEKAKPVTISAITPVFAAAEQSGHVGVRLQLGDSWINEQPYEALTFGSTLSFMVGQSIEDRLRIADHVTIRSDTTEFLLYFNPIKMKTLVTQVGKCRDSVPGWGNR